MDNSFRSLPREDELSVSQNAKTLLEIFLRRSSLGENCPPELTSYPVDSHLKVLAEIRKNDKHICSDIKKDSSEDSLAEIYDPKNAHFVDMQHINSSVSPEEEICQRVIVASTETLTQKRHTSRTVLNETPSSLGSTGGSRTPVAYLTEEGDEDLDVDSSSFATAPTQQPERTSSSTASSSLQRGSSSTTPSTGSFPRDTSALAQQLSVENSMSSGGGVGSASSFPPTEPTLDSGQDLMDGLPGSATVSRSLSQGDVQAKNRIHTAPQSPRRKTTEIVIATRQSKSSSLQSTQSGSLEAVEVVKRVSKQDSGYEADIDKKMRRRSRTRNIFQRPVARISQSFLKSGKDQTKVGAKHTAASSELEKLARAKALEYVQQEMSGNRLPAHAVTPGAAKTSHGSASYSTPLRANSLPRNTNTMVTTGVSPVQRASSGSALTASIISSVVKLAPKASFDDEDSLSDTEHRTKPVCPPPPPLSPGPVVKEKKKKKRKWYQRSKLPEDSIFFRLFGRAGTSKASREIPIAPSTQVIGGITRLTYQRPHLLTPEYRSDEATTISWASPLDGLQDEQRIATAGPEVAANGRLEPSLATTTDGQAVRDVTEVFRNVLDSNRFKAKSLDSRKSSSLDNLDSLKEEIEVAAGRHRLHLDVQLHKPASTGQPEEPTSSSSESQASNSLTRVRHATDPPLPTSTESSSGGSTAAGPGAEVLDRERAVLVARMLDLISNDIMGKRTTSSTQEIDQLSQRIDQLLIDNNNDEGTSSRTRNVSGCSTTSTVKPRSGSTVTSSTTDLTTTGTTAANNNTLSVPQSHSADFPTDEFRLDKAFRARARRIKHNSVSITDHSVINLARANAYAAFQQEMDELLGPKPGWRHISLLYYLTREAVKSLLATRLPSLSPAAASAQMEALKRYSMEYFDARFAGWVTQQGGWRSVVEDSENSEID